MILPLSMGEIARVRATIRARRAIPNPSSHTAGVVPLAYRGAAGGSCVPPVTGSVAFNERTRDREADGLVGGVQSVPVHAPENARAQQ